MAIIRDDKTKMLSIKVQKGSGTGTSDYATRNFKNINPALGDADAYEIATGLAALNKYPVSRNIVTDSASLIDE